MPQMAPMNWLTLFLVITSTFLVFNSLNFFSFTYSPKHKTTLKKSQKTSWKW
uniref:ATP synthase complex subunit 8 n=1 Tax=Ceruchus chrysomelinus TaxID=617560 RepID=A0A343C4G2_9SCAR|nr:ATP synthase F0 subunit 8 [Ceruchus chrysomelinus]